MKIECKKSDSQNFQIGKKYELKDNKRKRFEGLAFDSSGNCINVENCGFGVWKGVERPGVIFFELQVE